MKIAVLSDIHGNIWALETVLADLKDRKPDLIVNLGDTLYGPLKPLETYEMLKAYGMIHVSGNEDRLIVENMSRYHTSKTLDYVREVLPEEALNWLRSLPKTSVLDDLLFMCHGTPDSDSMYLLEQVVETFVIVNDYRKIEENLKEVSQKIILCGHSHIPRFVQTPLRTIINPGSVGCPAFDDTNPRFHKMENFNNNAQYCMLELQNSNIKAEQISLPYNYEKAVQCAKENNRSDWALWLESGRA